MIRSGKAAARALLHARVLLKADTGPETPAWSDEAIGEALERRWCINPNEGQTGALACSLYQTRCELGIPSWVSRLMTRQATRASVFCAANFRACSVGLIKVL